MDSELKLTDKVRILKPDSKIKYSRIEQAEVVGFTKDRRVIVEYRYQFVNHTDVFDPTELRMI